MKLHDGVYREYEGVNENFTAVKDSSGWFFKGDHFGFLRRYLDGGRDFWGDVDMDLDVDGFHIPGEFFE